MWPLRHLYSISLLCAISKLLFSAPGSARYAACLCTTVMYDFQVWPRGVASAGQFWHHIVGLNKQDLADRVNKQAQVMQHILDCIQSTFLWFWTGTPDLFFYFIHVWLEVQCIHNWQFENICIALHMHMFLLHNRKEEDKWVRKGKGIMA